ncbi:MAG TPA: peptidoglycan DD-metalloendopeptidase family protein [Actinomycetes bacterium]|nr:peptidoglycan DD-metalloendopeptidase family protein [Actinomycetes bacterium]
MLARRAATGRARLAAPLLVAALALSVGPLPTSHAATGPAQNGQSGQGTSRQTELEKILDEVRQELAESSEAMVRAAADLRLAEAALPGAQETAAHARVLLAAARKRQEIAARQRGAAQVRLMLSSQDAEETAAQVESQRARIGRLARAAYQGGGSLSDLSMLLEARSPTDFAERLVSLQTVVTSQRSLLDDLETVQQTSAEQTQDLAAVRDRLAVADARAQRELRAVTRLEAQARAAEARVGDLVAQREAALAAARAAQADDDAAHAHQQEVSGELSGELAAQARAELGAAGARDGSAVPARPGTLSWPVNGPVSSPFGMRVHPITGVYKLHTGTDLSASCGTPIHVARPGVVIAAGWNSAYGWRTVVSHGVVGGVLLTTTYNHQTRLGTVVGAQLAAGDVLGVVGSTGYSTGCHLHFELYVNATLVDPEPWLPAH